MEQIPHELFLGVEDGVERAARLGRWAILQEMGFFGDKSNLELAKHMGKGSWIGAIRKKFNGTYGDVRGCEPADIEIAAEYLGVFDDVFDVKARHGNRHLPDRRASD